MAEQSSTEAEYLASIAHLREQSIKDGKIYGDTLLRFDKLDENIKGYGSAENATTAYNSLNRLLLHDNPTENNKGTVKILNLVVFSRGALIDKTEHVAALVIGEQKAEGTYYTPPAELMQEYHQYLLDTYDVRPGTASAELDSMMGDLRPLAPEVLRVFERQVSHGMAGFKYLTPPEQQGDDSDWEDAMAEQSSTEAEYLASIAHLREQSIKDGKIYGDTLLRFDKLDESIKAYGSAEDATRAYNSMNQLLRANPIEMNWATAKILNMVVFSGGRSF